MKQFLGVFAISSNASSTRLALGDAEIAECANDGFIDTKHHRRNGQLVAHSN